MKNIRYIIILLLLTTAGYFSWQLNFKEYVQADTVDIHIFPKEIGDWTSEELTITEEEYAILETKNAFARKYSNSLGDDVFVFIVYSQYNRKVSHPPEICYSGGGVSILSNEVKHITDVPGYNDFKVNSLSLEQGRFKQFAYYWFKVGDSFTSSYWGQQGKIALNSLLNKNASSALIRVSSTIKNNNPGKTDQTIQKFVKQVLPVLPEYLP